MTRRAGAVPEETRAALVAAARREFAEHGYSSASIRSICSAAGVTTGALYFFFRNKEELFEAVWGEKYLDNNNTVMAHIARLREKLHEPPRKPRFIKTVWGVGYTIE